MAKKVTAQEKLLMKAQQEEEKVKQKTVAALVQASGDPNPRPLFSSKADIGIFPGTEKQMSVVADHAQRMGWLEEAGDRPANGKIGAAKLYRLTEAGLKIAAEQPGAGEERLAGFFKTLQESGRTLEEHFQSVAKAHADLEKLFQSVARAQGDLEQRFQQFAKSRLDLQQITERCRTTIESLLHEQKQAKATGPSASSKVGQPAFSAAPQIAPAATPLPKAAPVHETSPKPSSVHAPTHQPAPQLKTAPQPVPVGGPPSPYAETYWQEDALEYVDDYYLQHHRHCSLPDLFHNVAEPHDLTIAEFHQGMRDLEKEKRIALHPYTGSPHGMKDYQLALKSGRETLYYVERTPGG